MGMSYALQSNAVLCHQQDLLILQAFFSLKISMILLASQGTLGWKHKPCHSFPSFRRKQFFPLWLGEYS